MQVGAEIPLRYKNNDEKIVKRMAGYISICPLRNYMKIEENSLNLWTKIDGERWKKNTFFISHGSQKYYSIIPYTTLEDCFILV